VEKSSFLPLRETSFHKIKEILPQNLFYKNSAPQQSWGVFLL